MMPAAGAVCVSPELAEELQTFQRGDVVGALEGFSASGGVAGWACRWPGSQGAPLTVVLNLEDLLHSGRNWRLAELIAQRPRPDLPALERERDCGFLFLGHSGVELPPHSSGMVLRAFALAPDPRELAGSPLRLDSEIYAQLRELCHLGLGRPARLVGVDSHLLRGWASGAALASIGGGAASRGSGGDSTG